MSQEQTQCFDTQPHDEEDEEDGTSSRQEAVCRLVSLSDAAVSAELREGEALAIGRSHEEREQSGGLLVLYDPWTSPPVVSGKHALLRLSSSGTVSLEILSMSAFTFVNEQPHISRGKEGVPLSVALFDGDILRFGGGIKANERYDKFVFRVAAPTAVRPVPRAEDAPPFADRGSASVYSSSMDAGPSFRWLWRDSVAASSWKPYSAPQSALIERAYQMKETRVRLDAERLLDLCAMRQVRDDDRGRSRPVRREPAVEPLACSPRPKRQRGAHDSGESSGTRHTTAGLGERDRGSGGDPAVGVPRAADACTVRVLPSLARAKRATVRICTMTLRGGSGRWHVLTAGSGAIVSRDGHILTAAHLFLHPTAMGALFGGGSPAPEVLIAIGAYDTDGSPSKWAWWAELLTPIDLLREKDASGIRLLDLAILKVRGALALSPAVFAGVDEPYTVERRGQDAPPPFSDALRLGKEADVVSGCPLLVLGWPSPHGQRTIFVDSTHECISREGSLLRSRAFIHAGSSGGPALTASLQVVGVISHNPRSSDDTVRPPENGGEEKYVACIRAIERVALAPSPEGQGLTSSHIPLVTPPAAVAREQACTPTANSGNSGASGQRT